MAEEIYKDPIITKYFDLIKAEFGESFFKIFYQGDPIKIPTSNLPAIIISKDETRISNITNVEDQHQVALILTVITDIRDELKDEKSIVPGISKLYDIMEGRDASTLKLKAKSIVNVLRSNVAVDTALNLRTDLDTITRADYGVTVGKRQPEAWAVEAQLEFIANFTQIR